MLDIQLLRKDIQAVATRLEAVSIPTVIEQVGTLTTVVVRTTTPAGAPVGKRAVRLVWFATMRSSPLRDMLRQR